MSRCCISMGESSRSLSAALSRRQQLGKPRWPAAQFNPLGTETSSVRGLSVAGRLDEAASAFEKALTRRRTTLQPRQTITAGFRLEQRKSTSF
jgi:hypothetical protein